MALFHGWSKVSWGGRRLPGLVCVLLCLCFVSEVSAQHRDPDGTRMQARQMSVGSTQSQSLTPPHDVVDWRYIKLERSMEITIEVSSQPENVGIRLVLTSATGDELATVMTRAGSGTIKRSLDAGIYYISVGSSQSASYRISVR